jgi:hypothetical protein
VKRGGRRSEEIRDKSEECREENEEHVRWNILL